VVPVPGDWSKVRELMLTTFCGGDEIKLKWLLWWCAMTVKYPHIKLPFMLVIHGGQGIGKGFFFNNIMGQFFGKGLHFAHIVNPQDLVGQFNSMLALSVYVVLDEAIFPGDHCSVNVLKSLIRDNVKVMTQKFKDPILVQSNDHIVLITNEDHCGIKSDADDRANVIFECEDTLAENSSFFNSLNEQLTHGGLEAFLYHLMHEVDCQPRTMMKIPSCLDADRFALKLKSFTPTQQWLYSDVLSLSTIKLARYLNAHKPENATKYPLLLDKQVLYEHFNNSSHKPKHPLAKQTFLDNILNDLKSGKKTTKDQRYIQPNYNQKKIGAMAVEGTSFEDAVNNLRIGFMKAVHMHHEDDATKTAENYMLMFGAAKAEDEEDKRQEREYSQPHVVVGGLQLLAGQPPN
jgi:hypothetical protein